MTSKYKTNRSLIRALTDAVNECESKTVFVVSVTCHILPVVAENPWPGLCLKKLLLLIIINIIWMSSVNAVTNNYSFKRQLGDWMQTCPYYEMSLFYCLIYTII